MSYKQIRLIATMARHGIELPQLPRLQVPIIDANIDLMDMRRLAAWCERAAKDYAIAAIETDRARQGDSAKVLAELVALIPPADTLNASASCQDLIDYFKGVIADRKRRDETVEKPYPVKLHTWGGVTRHHDYEMSDGSIQTLKDTEAKELGWGRKPAKPVKVPSDDAPADAVPYRIVVDVALKLLGAEQYERFMGELDHARSIEGGA